MDFQELILSAVEALFLNKTRTALAMLGIIIGIGAVIALVSLGQAGQQAVNAQIQSLGANLLTVIPGSTQTRGVSQALGSDTSLTLDDAKALSAANLSDVSLVSPEVNRRAQVTAGQNNTNTQIIGATQTYPEVHNVTLDEGAFLTSQDIAGVRNVAVIGPQVASDLFGSNDPLGQRIRINRLSFTVVGVTVSKGGSGFGNQDDTVYIPITTAQVSVFGINYLSSIAVSAKSSDVMTAAENQIGYFLLQRHKLSDPSKADFSIFSQQDILGAASQVTGTFTALLSGIAAISLLVGGIGIMNIMLVTVIERTREIGLRKALGAKNAWVVQQFLVESILLTVVGGIFGMILGITLSAVIAYFIHLPFTISLFAIFLAIGVSTAIGVLFGWYPAKKAADLSPIEALRYE